VRRRVIAYGSPPISLYAYLLSIIIN